jgi:XRE family aerobic/anaerobic benzoate catabolism transcriptional regulator
MDLDLSPLGLAVRKARQDRGLSLRLLAELNGSCPTSNTGRGTSRSADCSRSRPPWGCRWRTWSSPWIGPKGPARIALVGLRGAGKSTIGHAVADRLNLRFIELDAEIESAAGLPLSQIFEIHGEAYYRRLEREVLEKILQSARGCVIATGGGLVTNPESWQLLLREARTIWLKARPEHHYQRVMEQGDLRPMKNRPSAMAELRALLAQRTPLYAEAHEQLDTSLLGLDRTVEAVCASTGFSP